MPPAVARKIEPDLRQRITRRLHELGRSPIDAASKGGLERNFIRDLVKEKKLSVNQKNLPKVAKGLDWTVAQLLGEELVNTSHTVMPPGGTIVPEIDVRAGGGGYGGLQEETQSAWSGEVRTEWSFPAPFLRDELHVRAGRVHIVPIRGDSMIDTLFDGDRAVIDLDDTDVSQGGIFALVDDDSTVIVTQVELLRGRGQHRILCTPRNRHYKPFELLLGQTARIIGRVACKITRL